MNEKDIKTIWQIPKYLPYIQPDLTEEIISDAEKRIGYKLPKEYIDLLKIQNGGPIRLILQGTVHRQIAGIGPYYPSITDFEWLQEYDDLSFDVKDLFPFDGDGHWNICFDYRKNKLEPEITYIDTESDYEKPIAATFKDYLQLLEIDYIENEYVIETDHAIDTALKQISDIANIEFREPDYWAYGYADYRSDFKDSWLSISPNISPAGFIREDDERYQELKSQMETTAVRYPEIPASALFIFVSEEDARQELFNKLKKGGLSIKAVKEYLE